VLVALFALLSAALFAGNAVTVRVALAGATATTIVLVSILTNLIALWAVAALAGDLGAALRPVALIFMASGVLAPALARLSLYTAIGMIGIARATVAGNTTPIFAALGAALFLGERVTFVVAFGTLAVVLGVALTSSTPLQEEPRVNRIGLLLAVGTAVLAAASSLLRKVGLQDLPNPALAGALTMTGALAGLLPLVILRARREPIRADRSALAPMLGASLLSSGGFLAYFVALHLGDVSRVAPLSNTTPLFVVLLLHFIFRNVESVTRRTLVGAGLTVGGVILVIGG
jgi:drug/metabolite transporter (DMT)-like permease